jgi:RimJ/RimL family protein N-acetyltransferase
MQEIFSVKCDEPGTSGVERKMYLMDFNKLNLYKLWVKARQFPVLFGHKVSNDFFEFCSIFLIQLPDGLYNQGMIWVVDDFVGAFYLTDANHPYDALVHYSFFDRRHKGRVELTRKMLAHVFTEYNYNRLSAQVPGYATKSAYDFVEKVGFRFEGTKRKAAGWNGNIVDVRCYGVLPYDLAETERMEQNGSKD